MEIKLIPTKLMLISMGIYLELMMFILQKFDFQTTIIYIVAGGIITTIAAMRVRFWSIGKIFMLGVGIALGYNLIGLALSWFTVSISSSIMAAVEQGVVAAIVYKVGGGKR